MQRNIPAQLVIFILSFLSISSAEGQTQFQVQIDSAYALLSNGQLEKARDIFQNIIDSDKHHVRALGGLSEFYFKTQDWGKTKEYAEKVLEIEPTNPVANYCRGIAYRETGKYKGPLLRDFDLNKSLGNLRFVTENNPNFRDCFYQLALTEYTKKHDKRTLELIHEQLERKPGLTDVQVDLYRYYRAFLRHGDQDEILVWLAQHKWEQAAFFIGEFERRKKNYALALVCFDSLLETRTQIPVQPLLLAKAKVYYAQNEPRKGEILVNQAFAQIETTLDAKLLFSEFKYIFTPEELAQFEQLSGAPAYRHFFQAFWRKRNPTPAAAENQRMTEHFRRFLVAEESYEYDGLRSWHNNPDKLNQLHFPAAYFLNEEFNDKGLIYIRHGEPRERVFTLGENVPTNESWRYKAADGKTNLFFHFFSAPDNNWRLGPIIENKRMLDDLAHWDPLYYRLSGSSPLERLGYQNELADKLDTSVSEGFSSDRYSFRKTMQGLTAPFSVATFRGDRNEVRFDIYVAVNIMPFNFVTTDDKPLTVETGFALFDSTWQVLDSTLVRRNIFEDTLHIGDKSIAVLQYSHKLAAQNVFAAFHVKPDSGDFLGGAVFNVTLPDYTQPVFTMSDIVLAYRIQQRPGSSHSAHGDLHVIPNATHTFQTDSPVQVYFEIYNLQRNDNDETNYAVEYNLTLVKKQASLASRFIGLFQKNRKESITIRNSRQGQREFSQESIGLDIKNMAKGLYQLQISITDKSTGLSTTRETDLVIE
ncbi:MAG: GWxTD domain-containing protein [Deferribacteres bacterium]|nr:GWxTD domain-containing protein [candidate division KSB1 bacterium]MCB9503621.1 GWxTD domain-containing protein [Deferribacteres bacterium]